MAITYHNRKIFVLDQRHVVRDDRLWKSSADPYYKRKRRLKPEVEQWLGENSITYLYGESPNHSNIYIDDAKQAMLFKMRWL